MSLYLYFAKKSPVKIWGLTSQKRITKILNSKAETVSSLSHLEPKDQVLIFRADYLFEDRLVKYLATSPDIVLYIGERNKPIAVAAHVTGRQALKALKVIEGREDINLLKGARHYSLESISVSFHQKLRKFEPPFVLPISGKCAKELEQRLFDWSYKGVTDLVTKWIWPAPARWAVKQCVRFHILPNHVTLMSFLLVIFTGYLFAYGYLGYGLVSGWIMTFLDTVDGKLARVTVTSSRFGHYFDHIIDLVHPPIWYFLWGIGLENTHQYNIDSSLAALIWWIVFGYIAGRLAEGIFQTFLGRFGIFCWRPLDSFFRLITARRNPNIILLTTSFLLGRPDLGLLTVAFWTVTTSLFLLLRTVWASFVKMKKGELHPWLKNIDYTGNKKSLAIRWFTQHTAN